jgi:hypothetical protein
MKQKYYRLDSINKLKAAYNILLGERSNGKSYAVKEFSVMRAWESDEQRFIMLRRWETDIKPSLVEQYFADCPISVITKNKCDGVSVYRGAIYLTKHNDETNAGYDNIANILLDKNENENDLKKYIGFNAKTDVYENLYVNGIIDPVKVVRSVLENASSIATMILTTECVLSEKRY